MCKDGEGGGLEKGCKKSKGCCNDNGADADPSQIDMGRNCFKIMRVQPIERGFGNRRCKYGHAHGHASYGNG